MASRPLVVWMPGGVRTEVHLRGEDTGGALCMLVDEPPPGWSLPPHRHADGDETIHVLEGEFEIDVAGERTRLRAGETIHVPKATVHSGGNVGPGAGRRIVIFTPAGIEGFFLEVGSAEPGEADLAAVAAAAGRYGWEFTRPA